MGELIILKGATVASADLTAAPMRQPSYASDIIGGAGRPASQCERLGVVVARVVERAEQHMNESAVAGCRGRI